MATKILIVTGDGGEAYEALYAYHRFLEAEYEPIIAAPTKRRLHLVMHDFEPGWDTYVERPGYGMEATASFDEVAVNDYEALVVLGGRAPEYLRNNAKLIEITRTFHSAGKWIFSICHGIQILIAAGLAQGRCLTCYENVRIELESAGGTFATAQSARDGKIVTSQTWQSHPEFYREIFRCLNEGHAA